jgi:hypothetical protein
MSRRATNRLVRRGNTSLFYHVIGDGKQRRWDVEAKGLGRFQINDEFEAGGLYDG